MNDFNVTVQTQPLVEAATPLLVVPVYEGEQNLPPYLVPLDDATGGLVRRLVERGDFRGKAEEFALVYPDPSSPASRIALVGCGNRSKFTREAWRRAVGTVVRQAERLRVSELAIAVSPVAVGEGGLSAYDAAYVAAEAARLGAWSFDELRSQPEDEPPVRVRSVTLIGDVGDDVDAMRRGASDGNVAAGAANLARELATRPGNQLTPTYLAGVAQQVAERHGLVLTVLDREQMEQEGLHALLAVARGTQEPPRFIVLEYRGAGGGKPLVLVGKGVTFDSGGISIKPSERMEEMKYDMSGAAAVLATIDAAATLGLRVDVVAIMPCTENLPSGTALKPGDVIRSHLGKTIEVVNTDAEGRLILADALSYARRFEPAAVVDVATLTGAVVIGLGHHAIGMLGTDDSLIEQVRAAGERSGERCWQLPLWDPYREQLKSNVADLKNVGGRAAGTITAAWFLREFVGDTPWVHLDIAGTAWRTEAVPSYLRPGATGVPVRLLIEWVRSRAES